MSELIVDELPNVKGKKGESVFSQPYSKDLDKTIDEIEQKVKFIKVKLDTLNDDMSIVIHSCNLIEIVIEEIMIDFLSIEEKKVEEWKIYTTLENKIKLLEKEFSVPYLPRHIIHSIRTIQKIRNKFSHKLEFVSFEDIQGYKGEIINCLKKYYPNYDLKKQIDPEVQFKLLVVSTFMSIFLYKTNFQILKEKILKGDIDVLIKL